MNILLIHPPIDEYASYCVPHLGIAYIASILTKNGYNVEVVDAIVDRLSFTDIEKILRNSKPDVVGITATTTEIDNAQIIASITKKINKSIITIIGGSHCTALPEQTLRQYQDLDVVIIGEGDHTILEILNCIEQNKGLNHKDLNHVDGIAYRNNNDIVLTKPRKYIDNLDEVPFPAWDKFPIKKYRGYLGLKKDIEIPIMAGRGCPYQCVFCQRCLGNKVRFRDPKNIVDEIEYDLSFGAKSILFCDETFSLNKQKTIEICDEIIRRGLQKKFYWHCQTRVDVIDLETLKKMKEAGCRMACLGLESGSDYILKKIKKGITTSQIINGFNLTKQVGLKTYMFAMFGHPYETEETIKKTIDLVMKINPDYLTIGILVPYPGTEVMEMAKRGEGGLKLLTNDWKQFSKQDSGVISVNNLDNKILKKYQSRTYAKFYFRPSRIMNLFEQASFRGIFNMAIKRFKIGAV